MSVHGNFALRNNRNYIETLQMVASHDQNGNCFHKNRLLEGNTYRPKVWAKIQVNNHLLPGNLEKSEKSEQKTGNPYRAKDLGTWAY